MMKFKILILCMMVLSLCSSYSMADETSHRAAAEELLLLTNPDALMKQVWVQVGGMMDQEFQQLGAPDDLKPVFKKYTDKMFQVLGEDLSFKSMKDDMITIYVNTYTEEEIVAISDFYKSPAGQKFIQKMPQLMQESMAIMQKKIPPLMQKIEDISKEMADEIKKLQAQQEG